MKKVTICVPIVVLFLWIATIPVVPAPQLPPALIDQRNDETTGCTCSLSNSLIFYHPMGQEFIPTKKKLLAVKVLLVDFGGGATKLNLTIWNGTIGNEPFVARTTFAVATSGWYQVPFRPPVSLNPGSKYVIQVELTDMTKNWGWTSDGRCYVDTYPDGTWIYHGEPQDGDCTNDLGFRTYAPPGN